MYELICGGCKGEGVVLREEGVGVWVDGGVLSVDSLGLRVQG